MGRVVDDPCWDLSDIPLLGEVVKQGLYYIKKRKALNGLGQDWSEA